MMYLVYGLLTVQLVAIVGILVQSIKFAWFTPDDEEGDAPPPPDDGTPPTPSDPDRGPGQPLPNGETPGSLFVEDLLDRQEEPAAV
jgi:hypothetical protein